jgi:hypothetical protein
MVWQLLVLKYACSGPLLIRAMLCGTTYTAVRHNDGGFVYKYL